MYSDARQRRAARRRRTLAWTVTLLFHLALLAALTEPGHELLAQFLPEKMQLWLGIAPESMPIP
ncbi:MAG: hypothetical protein D6765_11470 [Bacteroidetes bacterium]|nr:MAG: hypothetical protein D6765_11470 [Bacteroidota bacterium]